MFCLSFSIVVFGFDISTETLYNSRADLISRHLLEPVKALGFRIRAVISDADKNIRTSLPDCPHQACQVRCLCEAGAPILEADRATKTDLCRELSQSPQDAPLTLLAYHGSLTIRQ
jgi:hypothetical protein